ncbi:MAG: TPD domain-containing protein, partial [archaeon]
ELAIKAQAMPIAVAYALRQDLGYTRKDFQKIIRRASAAERIPEKRKGESRNERVYRELCEGCRTDWLHSPRALEYMKDKGLSGEAAAAEFLARLGIGKFKTENEQDKSGKTPDFLFEKLETLPGVNGEVKWFESKATFGTLSEVREDFKTQLSFYIGIFGPGAIIYWLGLTKEAREFLARESEGKITPFEGRELEGFVGESVKAINSKGLVG